MRFIILKLNLITILLIFESFVKTDIIDKGNQKSEIKKNHTKKLSKDDGGYIILYYKSEAFYRDGFKNSYRNYISYIINRNNNNLQNNDEEELYISAGTYIEIHFNPPPRALNNFFNFNLDNKALKIESIDLSNLKTSSVNTMEAMFYGCSSLKSIDLSNLNTSSLTDMENKFAVCSSLISIDLSNFNTSSITDMQYMFYACSSLKYIKLYNITEGDYKLSSTDLNSINNL